MCDVQRQTARNGTRTTLTQAHDLASERVESDPCSKFNVRRWSICLIFAIFPLTRRKVRDQAAP
jgi:hypothetical protein